MHLAGRSARTVAHVRVHMHVHMHGYARCLSTASGADGSGVTAHVSYKGRKRFYKSVSVAQDGESFTVEIDGRTLKTPHRHAVKVEKKALAEGIAYEWLRQKAFIEPASMPLMTLTCTAIDIAEDRHEGTVRELMRFLNTDTILFPGDPEDTDKGLLRLQKKHWTPLVKWAEGKYGPLSVCHGVKIDRHPEGTIEAVRQELQNLTPWEMTAVESLAAGCKSILIPLALLHRQITVKEAVSASRVEEEHQVNTWGLVEGGHDIDRAHLSAQVAAASVFLWLIR